MRCKFIQVADDAIVQGTVGLSNTRTCMGHTTGGQAVLLQQRQPGQACGIFAHTRIVENTECGPHRQGKSPRAQPTMGAADRQAAHVFNAQLGD